MAERRKADDQGLDPRGWMLTFSDMVTLLLTFFVMIISITSLDPKLSAEISGQARTELSNLQPGPGVLGFTNPALLQSLAEAIENFETVPPDASLDQDEIRAALFQLDPEDVPDYQRLELEAAESVSVFVDERGLVIRWDKSILFPEGTAILRAENLVLLDRLASLLGTLTLPVSVECHTNPLSDLEGGYDQAAWRLGARRARVVLGYLEEAGLPESRFRISSHGGGRPVTTDPERGAENSRLEIVIYTPPKSSWKG
jgi:chemotaxis protein MotB